MIFISRAICFIVFEFQLDLLKVETFVLIQGLKLRFVGLELFVDYFMQET